MADTDKDRDKHWLKWGMGLAGIVLLIVVGLFLLPTNDEADETAEAPGAEQSQAQDSSEDQDSGEPPAENDAADSEADSDEELAEHCRFDEPDTDLPTGHVEVVWAEHPYGPEVPGTEEHGPVQTAGGFYRCAAQTPTGAAMAAPALMMSFAYGWEEAAESHSVAESLYAQLQMEDTGTDFVFQGFRVDDYSEDRATISYWASSIDPSNHMQISFPLTVVWDDEADPTPDWRLDLSMGVPEPAEIENTSDYVELR